MNHGYIPWVFAFWQRRGLWWIERIVDRVDNLVDRNRGCDWFFASHGCCRRKGHRRDHRCGIHWAWPQGEGFQL